MPSTIAQTADPHGFLKPSDVAIRDLVADLDGVAAAMERTWGVGMLRRLVPTQWRERFDAQAAKLDAAIGSGLEAEIAVHAPAMARAWRKLDEVARALGLEPTPDDGRLYLEGKAWTRDQLAELVKAAPDAVAVIQAWPNARVASVTPIADRLPPLDLAVGDAVPF